MVASTAMTITAPKITSTNNDNFTVESPNIFLDAHEGALTAKGARYKPLYLA
jgi:hypothetical protein